MNATVARHGIRLNRGGASVSAAVDDVVASVLQLDGLTRQVGSFALPADTCDAAPDIVEEVCRALDVPLTFDALPAGPAADYAAVALAAELHRAQRRPVLAASAPDAAARSARRIRDAEAVRFRRRPVPRPDGAVVSALEAGAADGPCIVISAPPTLSYRLVLPWVDALSNRYRCVVAQLRGAAEQRESPDRFDRIGHDVEEQVGDLIALLEQVSTRRVHLMGLCAGAAVAMEAAARRPDLVGSLSLWHADLELGPDVAKTDHQVNLRAILDVARGSRETSDWMRARLVSGPMTGVPAGLGPLVARPYATPELFFRYAELTAPTMHRDARPAARLLDRPCLVVTSRDDDLAHPAGSVEIAGLMPRGQLVWAAQGTHLDAFRATHAHVDQLVSFLDDQPAD